MTPLPTPEAVRAALGGPVSFTVTEPLVRRFVELSGDASSLHTDEGFAHRSLYRGRVIHGMLPLLFVAALDWHRLPGAVRLATITTSFLKPVHVGDALTLTLTSHGLADEAQTTELELEIRNEATGAIVTTGMIGITAADAAAVPPDRAGEPAPAASAALLIHAIAEETYLFEEIQKGQESGFSFSVSAGAVAALAEILALGTAREVAPAARRFDAPALLATALLSTLVGMAMPGRRATFVNFALAFAGPVAVDTEHRLTGRVSFKSASTSSLMQTLTIAPASGGAAGATGKLHVRVNPPAPVMAAMESLRAHELDLQLKDKVVLITGASRGLGETTAKLFALHGAKVILNYHRSQAEAERIVGEIAACGGRALCWRADVADRAQVRELVRAAVAEFGTIHVLVNNAVRDAQAVPFAELTWERLEADWNVVVKGAFNCCQEVLPLMVGQHFGKIINLSTLFVENPPPGQTKYVVAKSALVGLTRCLAVEYARHNIQVNLVVPGMMETDLSQHVGRIFVERAKGETPMGRLAAPAEAAKAIVFLASSLASFTTGQKVMVTGGAPPLL